MSAAALIAELRSRGITLVVLGDRLRFRPRAKVDARVLARLRAEKAALVDALRPPTLLQAEICLGNIDPRVLDPNAAPIRPCDSCLARAYRRRRGCPWICDRCHPSPRPDDPELERMEIPPAPDGAGGRRGGDR